MRHAGKIINDLRALQTALEDQTQSEMKTQKYYIVIAAPNTPPLAMFQHREWAEEWRDRYSRTSVIE